MTVQRNKTMNVEASDHITVGSEKKSLTRYYGDFHVHIGRTEQGQPVKISGSKDLTFYNIAHEASERKGIELIGIIDCHSPHVQAEMERYLDQGEMTEVEGGGIRFRRTTIFLGSEIEVRDEGLGPAHLLAFLPTLNEMQDFTGWMKKHMKNITLSSQRIYVPAKVLQEEVVGRGGILIPAHVFTPYRSVYGSCTDRMEHLLDLSNVTAVELGLSSDSEMAGLISELDRYTFVTNSDAHSLGKIGREYNELALEEANFNEWAMALRRENKRAITANYGLNPRLGKYHRTYCAACESTIEENEGSVERCAYCGSSKIVRGVMDRIWSLADREQAYLPEYRPPYNYQIPLQFIPGLGKKKLDKLLSEIGTEMYILHDASFEELSKAAGEEIASYIIQARSGQLSLQTGGGGKYGKVKGLSKN